MRRHKKTIGWPEKFMAVKCLAVYAAVAVGSFGVSGCTASTGGEKQSSQRSKSPTRRAESVPAKASQTRGDFAEKDVDAGERRSVPPSRIAPVGHAVAMAGLFSDAGKAAGRLLIHDPADNCVGMGEEDKESDTGEEGGGVHEWIGAVRECGLTFGDARPVITLAGSKHFTVVGAVIIRPADASVQQQVGRVVAHRMPDLSQNIRPVWSGLCAAASAADVLYCIGRRDDRLLGGRVAGPSPLADKEADRLIAGTRSGLHKDEGPQQERTAEGSLAFTMRNVTGSGASAVNIADGLRSWVADHAPGSWRVDIDFLEDSGPLRSPEAQLKHLQEWAGAIGDGGGGIVLLWPSMRWSEAVDFDADGSKSDADPTFPRLLPSQESTARDGKPAEKIRPPRPLGASPPSEVAYRTGQEEAAEQLIAELRVELQNASGELRRGEFRRALRLATQVIERSLPVRFVAPEAEQVLAEATRIAAEASAKADVDEKQNPKVSTRFDG